MDIAYPGTVEEAVAALESMDDPTVLSGGTDVMVEVNAGVRNPSEVVAVRRVRELHSWDGRRIGAGVTYREMERGSVRSLAQAARTVGSPQIRAAGTIGGNLGTGSPAGDTLPILSAYGAEIELRSAAGVRMVPISEFITGVKETVLRSGELITAIELPAVAPAAEAFAKVGVRSSMVISMVSGCALRWPDGRITLALGAVAPVPLRMVRAEELLADHLQAGRPADGAVLDEVAELVRADVRPITDKRATADYRRHAAGVLARRLVARVATRSEDETP
jgi:CO/xanthine dehydrogenase FAD-binding subunit